MYKDFSTNPMAEYQGTSIRCRPEINIAKWSVLATRVIIFILEVNVNSITIPLIINLKHGTAVNILLVIKKGKH
jgi:hypothetical protein